MPKKQTEGDSVQRRRAAKEARLAGTVPSAEGATLGASKQHRHLTASATHDERTNSVRRGKLPSVGQGRQNLRPGSGRPEQTPT